MRKVVTWLQFYLEVIQIVEDVYQYQYGPQAPARLCGHEKMDSILMSVQMS